MPRQYNPIPIIPKDPLSIKTESVKVDGETKWTVYNHDELIPQLHVNPSTHKEEIAAKGLYHAKQLETMRLRGTKPAMWYEHPYTHKPILLFRKEDCVPYFRTLNEAFKINEQNRASRERTKQRKICTICKKRCQRISDMTIIGENRYCPDCYQKYLSEQQNNNASEGA